MASFSRGHSCEPGRKAAYSEDIRWRMVWQRQVQGLTLDQVATNLCVDTSTVHRIVSRFQATGVQGVVTQYPPVEPSSDQDQNGCIQ